MSDTQIAEPVTFAQRLVVDFLHTAEGRDAATKCITKVLVGAIESATGYNSPFRKQVDAAIAKALQLSGDVEIESYNDAILKIIERQVEHATADAIERQVAGRMKDLLTPAPAEIKLSELIEQYREYLRDRQDGGCVCSGDATFTFTSKSDGEFHYVGLDDEAQKPHNRCDIRFGAYKGKVFSLAFDNSEVEKRLFVGPLYGFHRLLFQMKAAQTTVVMDCEPGDVSLTYAVDD